MGNYPTALDVLRELVDLKDGPRDGDYLLRKPIVWQQARAVVRRDATLEGERDLMRVDLNEAYRLLEGLRQWDHMQTAGDGPYWLAEIERVLGYV